PEEDRWKVHCKRYGVRRPCRRFDSAGMAGALHMQETVVITGASAGVGRATAQLFGRRGAKVGLIARGRDGLEAPNRESETARGGELVPARRVAVGAARG